MTPKEVVIAFWQAMGSNDFYKEAEWLPGDFQCHWPQSSEVIIGRENFAEINTHYPAKDTWTFIVNSIICEGNQVVTDVSISDGALKVRAITFHTVENEVIVRQREFWSEDYEAPDWRRKWVMKQQYMGI